MLLKPALLAAPVLALSLSVPAQAQAPEGGPPEDFSLNFVSGGVAVLPDYSGSDDYRFIPFGAFRYEFDSGITLRTDGPGIAAELYESGPVVAGAYARWSGGRNDLEDAVVSLLPEVGNSIITGGFVEVDIVEGVFNDFDEISLGARAGVDALGEFEGVVWSVSATYLTPLARRAFFGVSVGVNGVSDDYADQLFAIDAAGAAASGLPVYTLEGGIENASLTTLLTVPVGGNWSVTGLVSYSKLLGDFADSPVVSIRGDENQVFAGAALGWSF